MPYLDYPLDGWPANWMLQPRANLPDSHRCACRRPGRGTLACMKSLRPESGCRGYPPKTRKTRHHQRGLHLFLAQTRAAFDKAKVAVSISYEEGTSASPRTASPFLSERARKNLGIPLLSFPHTRRCCSPRGKPLEPNELDSGRYSTQIRHHGSDRCEQADQAGLCPRPLPKYAVDLLSPARMATTGYTLSSARGTRGALAARCCHIVA
jgi:hypothetical protein